jgi:hypothetical protein
VQPKHDADHRPLLIAQRWSGPRKGMHGIDEHTPRHRLLRATKDFCAERRNPCFRSSPTLNLLSHHHGGFHGHIVPREDALARTLSAFSSGCRLSGLKFNDLRILGFRRLRARCSAIFRSASILSAALVML